MIDAKILLTRNVALESRLTRQSFYEQDKNPLRLEAEFKAALRDLQKRANSFVGISRADLMTDPEDLQDRIVFLISAENLNHLGLSFMNRTQEKTV